MAERIRQQVYKKGRFIAELAEEYHIQHKNSQSISKQIQEPSQRNPTVSYQINTQAANMKFSAFAATVFVAFAGFAAAIPAAGADTSLAADGAMGDMFEIETRQCRRIGARCRRDRQCCSRECDDGRCERDDD